ncbi:MAG: transglycosylase SLT domain-containing protein [Clostridia bacterium]|nr:transglycosylase SLT domain-containing protein [Clostridia bacterium]
MKFTKRHILLLILCLVLIIALPVLLDKASQKITKQSYPLPYLDMIEEISEKYSVDKSLICAIVYCQSQFNEALTLNDEKAGLMQLSQEAFARISVLMGKNTPAERIYDPYESIDHGIFYLTYLCECYGDMESALTVFYAETNGLSTLKIFDGKDIDISLLKDNNTDKYIKNVYDVQQKYKDIYFG